MPTRDFGHRSRTGRHQGRILEEDLARAIALTDPELFHALGVPGEGAFGTVDLERVVVLATGRKLADRDHAVRTTGVAEKDAGVILGRDLFAFVILGLEVLASKGLDGLERLLADRDECREIGADLGYLLAC